MMEHKSDIPEKATSTAADPVFALPELVERIIFGLPPLDILAAATRVSRT
jgi:hypothetical protein